MKNLYLKTIVVALFIISFSCTKKEVVLTAPMITTTDVNVLNDTSVTSGGIITSDGGSPITLRGIVWDLSSNPTIILSTKTNDGSGIGTFSSSTYSLKPGTTYYVRAYATNSIGTSYGNEVVIKTKILVGSKFGGGVVAYILQVGDLGYESNTTHGIIASLVDQSQKILWNSLPDRYDFTLTGANGTKIGTGLTNTNKIISVYNSPSGIFAASIARNYNGGSFNDWFLPSKDELNIVYLNKLKIGGFATYTLPPNQIDDWYWTSSEINASYAEAIDFTDGHLDGIGGYKGPGGTPYKVRAVRYF